MDSRVNSMKSKFEKLGTHALELDVLSRSLAKPKPSFVFRRSHTTLNLTREDRNNSRRESRLHDLEEERDRKLIRSSKRDTSPSNELLYHLDTFRLGLIHSHTAPLSDTYDRPSGKFQRHNDAKHKSIKRSPAFRATNSTRLSLVVPNDIEEVEFGGHHSRYDLEEPLLEGYSDTLKKALKQPLPAGPPPKKPPRLFESPNKDGQHLVELNADDLLKSKINFLEHNLQLRTAKQPAKGQTKVSSSSSSNNILTSCLCILGSPSEYESSSHSKFDDTVIKTFPDKAKKPSEHIYMVPFGHLKDRDQPKHQLVPHLLKGGGAGECDKKADIILVPDTLTTTNNLAATNAAMTEQNNNNNNNQNNGCANNHHDDTLSSGSTFSNISSINNLSSTFLQIQHQAQVSAPPPPVTPPPNNQHNCPDNHGNHGEDLHYLCTNLVDSFGKKRENAYTYIATNDEDDTSIATNKSINTYDQINLLVDVAFDEKNRSNNTTFIMDSPTSSLDYTAIHQKFEQNNGNSNSKGSGGSQQPKTIHLSRSLTEKRKEYVRRMSNAQQKSAAPKNTYGTLHRTFKPATLKTFQDTSEEEQRDSEEDQRTRKSLENVEPISSRISKYKQLIEASSAKVPLREKSEEKQVAPQPPVVDLPPVTKAERLFQMCLLIGFNISNNQPYVKARFPGNEEPPTNIEYLVFPSKQVLVTQTKASQNYTLILTDDMGERIYGYCRRVIPESSEVCLPLSYCLTSDTKAPGFYFKVLQEIESRHGNSELQMQHLVNDLQLSKMPAAGKFLHMPMPKVPPASSVATSHSIQSIHHQGKGTANKRLSLEVNPKWLTEAAAVSEKKPPFDLSLINRSLLTDKDGGAIEEIMIRRPNDIRLESTELSDLFEVLDAEMLLSVFGSLLLERKVILYSENMSVLSSSILALDSLLYPFQWQYPLITLLPQNLMEICQAPFPVLAGTMELTGLEIEEGILVNLDTKEFHQKCGDERTLLPENLRKSLIISLEMVDMIDKGKMLSNVLIAEAFLRFFVELFSNFNVVNFEKDKFIQSHACPSVRLFLEWFLETSMFRHFFNTKSFIAATAVTSSNGSAGSESRGNYGVKPKISSNNSSNNNNNTSNGQKFYTLFDSKLIEKCESKSKTTNNNAYASNMELIMKNCRILNKKTKSFKDRFKDLF